jgi:hypothetical protein
LIFELPEFVGQRSEGCVYRAWFGFRIRCAHPERSCFCFRCEDYRAWGTFGGPAPVRLGDYAAAWFDRLVVERLRASRSAERSLPAAA